jgi:hypothetical protein
MALTPKQVQELQAKDAARARTLQTSPAAPPTTTAVAVAAKGSTALTLPDNRSPLQQYIDEISPAGIVGREAKFDPKGAKFITTDDDAEIPEGTEFIALCDQTLAGYIRFNGPGERPDKVMGLIFDGFVMPRRQDLGDTDESIWPPGLNGRPEDPWKHQLCVVLQHAGTSELYTFVTASATGRRAVGNLLQHYSRMQRANPNELPVVRLKKGGFQHKDDRVGFVPTPVFAVVGRVPRDSAATPDTSPSADLNDEIPYRM